MVLVTTGWQSPRLVGQTACWTLRVGHCLLLALYVYYQVLKCSRRMFCLRCLSAAAMRALKRTTEPPAFARARVWVRSGTVWVRRRLARQCLHIWVEMGGKVFGTLGTVWVRGEYSADAACSCGHFHRKTIASGFHSGRSSASSTSSSSLVFGTRASEPFVHLHSSSSRNAAY